MSTQNSEMQRLSTKSSRRGSKSSLGQDKENLAGLNDRLACYIGKVRYLVHENDKLKQEVLQSQGTASREVDIIKALYERELSDSKKLLDDTAHKKAKLEIENQKLRNGNKELRAKLDKETKNLEVAEYKLSISENKCTELQALFDQKEAEKNKSIEREIEAEKESKHFKILLDDALYHLQNESLQRASLENQLQSLKEDATFQNSIFEQELAALRKGRQICVPENDSALMNQYDTKLQQSLQELRNKYEGEIQANRDKVEEMYKKKIENLESNVQHHDNAAKKAMDDLRQLRAHVRDLNQKMSELEATANDLKIKLRDLENLRENDKSAHSNDLLYYIDEIIRLNNEMSEQHEKYEDLLDIKNTLSFEMATFKKLLDSQEIGLDSPSSEGEIPLPVESPIRFRKRKRAVSKEAEEKCVIM